MHNMPVVAPVSPRRVKCAERVAMEALGVGDGFWVTDADRVKPARDARHELAPRKFTVTKVPNVGWQVRRTQ